MFKVDVMNVPDYAYDANYVVARFDEETRQFWFFGAWDDEDEAENVAMSVEGFVFKNSED